MTVKNCFRRDGEDLTQRTVVTHENVRGRIEDGILKD